VLLCGQQRSPKVKRVLRAKTRGHRDIVAVVGHAATIVAGEWILRQDTSLGTENVRDTGVSTNVAMRIDGEINRGVAMPSHPHWLAVAISIAAASPASADQLFDARAICRTAIAAITGRDLKLFQAAYAPDGVVALTYVRPFDNFVWAYHCRLEGNRVIWADEPGRWRQDARDDMISFETIGSGAQLRITKTPASGAATHEVFDRDKFLER
jgi:hypothetical protein